MVDILYMLFSILDCELSCSFIPQENECLCRFSGIKLSTHLSMCLSFHSSVYKMLVIVCHKLVTFLLLLYGNFDHISALYHTICTFDDPKREKRRLLQTLWERKPAFSPFLTMFSTLPRRNSTFLVMLNDLFCQLQKCFQFGLVLNYVVR